MSSGARWCGAVRVVTPLSTFTCAYAHACFDSKRHVLVQCGTSRYSIKYIHTGMHVEGHDNARQRLVRGIPALQRIPSYLCRTLLNPWPNFRSLKAN